MSAGKDRLEELRALKAAGRLVLKARASAPPDREGAPAGPPETEEPLDPAKAGDGAPGPFVPVATGAGPAWSWRTVYPADFVHGREDPGTWWAALERSLALLAAVAGPAGRRQPVPPGPGSLLFLDLETTGLAVAAGHRPFLAGLAWFGPAPGGGGRPALHVEQLLIPDLEPGTERGWLAALAHRVVERPWLVTFNGRGFDWPMLETRWRWNREDPPALRAHFDLLYPARRLWAAPGRRVNLRALEQRLLGFTRRGDVAGAEIPARFADFLHAASGAAGSPPAEALSILAPVLRHNRLDLLSLVGITARVGGWLAGGPARAVRWEEALAAGREWERVDGAAAVAWYERALALASGRAAVSAIARRLVPLYRRQKRWAEAVALLAALCDAHHPLAPIEPWLDLAELWLQLGDRERAAHSLAEARRLWERRRRLWRVAPATAKAGPAAGQAGGAGSSGAAAALPPGPLGRRMEQLEGRLAAGGHRQARAL